LQIPEVHHHLHPHDHRRLSGHRLAGQLPGKPLSDLFFFQKQVNDNLPFLLLGSASEASVEKEPMSCGKILTSGHRGKAKDSYVQQLSQFDALTTVADNLAYK
jgi:hypothetical protein